MKLRPFELSLVIIFIALFIGALSLLALFKGGGGEPATINAPVTIWGTMPADGVNDAIRLLSEQDESYRIVTYKYFSPEEFDNVFVNALADKTGPDLVLLSHEKLVEMRRRIQPIPYFGSAEFVFPRNNINEFYLDGTKIFALSDGMYGYPIAVDPLMMYWNKNTLSDVGYLEPPRTWESLVNTYFPTLIQRDSDRTVRKSVVAMGEYSNVRNAFGVISALMMQNGSKLVFEDSKGFYSVQLQLSLGASGDPLSTAADFFTRFSKPNNTLYSWNRSFTEDRARFTSEDLALYFGYGSEGRQIEKINPNLSFDIAEIPQNDTGATRRTYGRFYALSMLKSTDNIAGATEVLKKLGSVEVANQIAIYNNMVPVFRNYVTQGSNDIFGRKTYQSAVYTFGWLNPDLEATNQIFTTMTKDINENRRDLSSAVTDVSGRLTEKY
ncbi:hypothetical protein H6784_05285 [Candidatus Nomurabacteria bacterium]|nr:hypothetical protein [Candidatus Kaiserbacteria bacterium]MCB9814793.1 hypothetical protein [Candidatus Nomurabacteria bacterium]